MSFNFCAMVVGPPEYGKTTLASALVRKALTESPASIVLAHDPVYQFGKSGCHAYRDAAAWRAAAALAHHEGKRMPRGASIGGASEDITALALELGERLNRADDVRLQIWVPYDEASLMSDSGSTFISKSDNELLATRRHRGIAPIYNVQQPTQLTKRFWLMCTDAYMFMQTSKDAKTLDGYLLLEPGTLVRAGITRLPMHKYIHVHRGQGIVGAAL